LDFRTCSFIVINVIRYIQLKLHNYNIYINSCLLDFITYSFIVINVIPLYLVKAPQLQYLYYSDVDLYYGF